MVKTEWMEKGFVDEPVDKTLDLKTEIRKLCREKDAIILAHYYTVGDIQEIADFVGDSLALARKADRRTDDGDVRCAFHGRNLQTALSRQGGALSRPHGRLFVG